MSKKNKTTVIVLLIIAVLLIVVPFLALKGAEFGGSDDAGSDMISEIKGEEVEPWAEPILEKTIGGELPGEIESLIFCVQTGIGVGVLFFFVGRFYENKKLTSAKAKKK